MDEKTMVNDILEGTKAELTTYQGVISEAENMQLNGYYRIYDCGNIVYSLNKLDEMAQ